MGKRILLYSEKKSYSGQFTSASSPVATHITNNGVHENLLCLKVCKVKIENKTSTANATTIYQFLTPPVSLALSTLSLPMSHLRWHLIRVVVWWISWSVRHRWWSVRKSIATTPWRRGAMHWRIGRPHT